MASKPECACASTLVTPPIIELLIYMMIPPEFRIARGCFFRSVLKGVYEEILGQASPFSSQDSPITKMWCL